MKKLQLILLLTLIFASVLTGQSRVGKIFQESAGYYNFNAVTEASLLTNTDVFLYGSFSKTKADKLTGSKTASKYIVWSYMLTNDWDSTRTLALNLPINSYDNNISDDYPIKYYCSVLGANGRYSKGLIDTIYTPIWTPDLDTFQDTFEVNVSLDDISIQTKQIVYYKNGIKTDSVQHNYITDGSNLVFSDSAVNTGAYYKVKVYGTYTSALSDSVYIEPIVPFLPAPTNLTGISDTTGIKITWQDNSINEDGFYVRRSPSISAGSFLPNIDTVASNTTEYCDSLPNISSNTDYVYEVYAFKDNYGSVSNKDTLTAIYNIASSSVVSIDSSIISIDTTLGTGGLIAVETYTSVTYGTGVPTSVIINRPTGIENNDLMVAIIASENDTSGATPQYSMQNDWTHLGEGGNSTQAVRIGVFYKVSDGTEDLTDTITVDMTNSNVVAFWLRISNADISDIINTSNFTQASGNALQHLIPAITTDADSCLIIAGLAFDGADYLGTLTNGFDWRSKQDTISAYYGSSVGVASIWGSKTLLNAGSSGVDTVTVGSSDGAAYFMLAINGNSGTGTIIDTTWGNYDTTFAYTLTAFNCAEDEPPLPPVAPTSLDTTLVTSSSVLLTWDDVEHETAYYIQRKLRDQSITAFSNIGSTTANDITYTDDTVTDSTWYTYRVYASNASGNSAYSDTLRIFTDDVVEDVDPPTPGIYTDTLYVTTSASGSGDGQSIGNPYTLGQAISSVNAGNLVLLSTGAYNIAPFISFTRAGTYNNPIEWRGTVYPSDSSGLTYSSNSTVFYNTAYNSANSSGVFRVNAPYNTFKGILMHNSNAQQFGFVVIDADATRTIFDGINWKYTPSVTSSSVHSWRVYADSVQIKNSYFNRGARCIIWVTTNGDGANTIRTFLLDGNVFTGAGDVDNTHGAVQFMPNTTTTNPNWLEDVTIRNNIFIGNTTGWNLHMRYFRRANVYNNLFVNSGGVFVNDRHYPNDTDSLNSEGSLFVYNTIVDGSGGTIAGINRQMNGVVFANNLQTFTTSPSYIWRFTNLAVGEEPFNRGHFFDYNFFDIIGSGSISSVISSWNTASDTYVNVNWTAWKALGFDNHTVIDTAPTFLNTTYYKPLNGSSPQVGIGIPITTANGFRISITTDRFGNTRSATNPTAGWAE